MICAARRRGSLKARTCTTCRGAAGWPSGADNESSQTGATRRVTRGGSRSPLPVRFVGGGQLVEKGAVHLHQRLQHVVHQRHDGPSTQQQKGLASAIDNQSTIRLRFHFLNTHGSHYLFLFFKNFVFSTGGICCKLPLLEKVHAF